MVTASDWVGFTLPGIMDEPGSLAGKVNSPYPALGPEPKNLISFAIFNKQAAVVLRLKNGQSVVRGEQQTYSLKV